MSNWDADFDRLVREAREAEAAARERHRSQEAERLATVNRMTEARARDYRARLELERLITTVTRQLNPAYSERVGFIHGTPGEPGSFSVGRFLARTRAWPSPVAGNMYLAVNGRLLDGWQYNSSKTHEPRVGFRGWVDLKANRSTDHEGIRNGLARLVARYGR